MKDIEKKIKFLAWIIFTASAILATVFSLYHYFAKTEDVQQLERHDVLLEERLDIAIVDDQIFQVEQQVQQMKNYTIFEQRTNSVELSSLEKEAIEDAESRLDELKKEKKRKIESYERMKQSN